MRPLPAIPKTRAGPAHQVHEVLLVAVAVEFHRDDLAGAQLDLAAVEVVNQGDRAAEGVILAIAQEVGE